MQTDRWSITTACPDDWGLRIERHGGGFFHSPAALQLEDAPATPFFARLRCGADVAGIAAGVLRRCRLSPRPRHAYLPTPPALDRDVAGDSALTALAAVLARKGMAELVVDSYDARWMPRVTGTALAELRQEYIVPLGRDASPQRLAGRCAVNHRHGIRRGERERWTLRTLTGESAHVALAGVQHAAASRATERGHGFTPYMPARSERSAEADFFASWGAVTMAAFNADVLLAAARIGWGGRRAFYRVGGSTMDGYRVGAAAWLHWRIMCVLAERGFSAYNLGGTPASAAHADDPMHGLFRFKTGFGATCVPCRGVYVTLSHHHRRAHGLANRIAGVLHA
ncbi:MAG TPA: peptidoglycan bridge formation glycyltransferase FemA/FemB family protein [Gemmatimonadaceae bacterium]|jgi:hypothetical protein|nr:peptidoglycan bridge formation glycyltransferase FemA/FemB family protein [Gemmatimonadaceae bacterium]